MFNVSFDGFFLLRFLGVELDLDLELVWSGLNVLVERKRGNKLITLRTKTRRAALCRFLCYKYGAFIP
jgi:hypothetical protein